MFKKYLNERDETKGINKKRMAQSLMMGYERLFLLSIFISAVICNESSDQLEDMNPILRYRFGSHLKERLNFLSSFAKKQSRNSLNCFFSPIQCHLPVAAINDMETLSKRFRSKP
uniref:Uncharacterized protein n=1 Tax=Parascaris univalens TaxID=6257 RepID=A0A915AGX0_PARUN